MLNWLRRRYLKSSPPGAPRSRGTEGMRVSFDDETIVLRQADGEMASLPWEELSAVVIITTDGGPFEADLIWLLQGPHRHASLAIPMGIEGEHDFLRAMQSRLPGFDNMAVIEAMGSTDNASFTVWEAPHPAMRRPVA